MFNSDLTANRPAAGIVGRIFIAIDSPYGIFRDTGTAWDQISSAGGGATIYTGDGTLTGDRTISSGGFQLVFNPQTTFFSSLTASTGASSFSVLGSNALTFAAGFSSSNIGNVYGANGAINAQNFLGNATFAQANLASAMVNVNKIDFGSGGHTITMTQSTAPGIRAMTGVQNQIQFTGSHNGTISHAAISQNLGFFRESGSTRTLTITNAYSLLINPLDDYGAGFTFTNRFGIYQAGASDTNYFAARVGIGITAPTEQLHVIGAGLFNSGAANFPLQGVSTSSLSLVRLTNSSGSVSFGRDGTFASIEVNATGRLFISSVGNTLLGASTDNGNRLQVYGNAFVNATLSSASVTHTNINNPVNLQAHAASAYIVNASWYTGNQTAGSGTKGSYITAITFSPPGGSATYVGYAFENTINQTAGANGITRGLYINPTLTSAFDWRAIEITAGISILAPSTTASATLRVPSGTAPTSPVDGDIWFNGTNLFMRIGGVTRTFTII